MNKILEFHQTIKVDKDLIRFSLPKLSNILEGPKNVYLFKNTENSGRF
jgi:hypothetical protein